MDINRVIHIAVEAGRIMLENGAETYRVEETIYRICNAYNINEADSFVTPTGIMVSVANNYGQTISLIKRIKVRTVDLEKISLINDLSRSITIEAITLDSFEENLKKIDNEKKYSNSLVIFGAAILSGFLTLLFGGNFYDFIISLIIGGLIKASSSFLQKLKINDFFINVVGGAIAALIALLSMQISAGLHEDKIIIGSIMQLVPGLTITNAVRDTIAGDLMAGMTRAAEAFLTAIAIAIGTGTVFKIWFSTFGGISI